MYTASFWKGAAERAVKTFAQALAAFLVADTAFFDVDWERGVGVSATAAVLSVLTSIVSAPVGPSGSPSVVRDPAAAADAHF